MCIVDLTLCCMIHQVGYDMKTTGNRRGSCHWTEIGSIGIQPLPHTINLLGLFIFLRFAAISQKLLNVFKTLGRVAIPSHF